jgi:hypothetical protein
MLRFNSTTGSFEGYNGSAWGAIGGGGVTSFQTSLSGLTPSTSTTGVITLAGTLGATSGGTGLSAISTGDILYGSATNTISRLAAGTNGYVLTLSAGIPTWAAGGGGGSTVPTGGGTDAIFYNNGQTVNTSYTIPTNNNSGTFGPITIAAAATVTVPAGSTWSIV